MINLYHFYCSDCGVPNLAQAAFQCELDGLADDQTQERKKYALLACVIGKQTWIYVITLLFLLRCSIYFSMFDYSFNQGHLPTRKIKF